jgi:hypothetical protein
MFILTKLDNTEEWRSSKGDDGKLLCFNAFRTAIQDFGFPLDRSSSGKEQWSNQNSRFLIVDYDLAIIWP